MEENHHSPLAQFEIHPIGSAVRIGGIDVSFTNSSLWMAIIVTAIVLFMIVGMQRRALIPGRWQALCEMLYDFVGGILQENAGAEGRKYFPLIFTLFMFILFANLMGLLPGAFTVTSHLIVTFAMAGAVFLGVTAVAISRHGLHFFTYFIPKGAPLWMLPLIIPIEIVSYFIRPVTLSVRLFANMVAGHVMLAVIGGFVFALGIWGGWLPLTFVTAIIGLEFLIACLQAYVFTILTCIYLNDALHLHH